MITKQITIINKLGLHARAAVKLMNTASRFVSDVHLRNNGRLVDAKNVMEIMVLGISQGRQVEVQVSGPDEHEAMAALEKLIQERFGEDE